MDKKHADPLAEWFPSFEGRISGDAPATDDVEPGAALPPPLSGSESRKSRRALIVIAGAAIVLWTVVVMLGAVRPTARDDTSAPDAADDAPMRSATDASSEIRGSSGRRNATGGDPAPDAAAGVDQPLAGGAGAMPMDGDGHVVLNASAVIALHDRVTGTGTTRWVDAAAIESIERVGMGEGMDPAVNSSTDEVTGADEVTGSDTGATAPDQTTEGPAEVATGPGAFREGRTMFVVTLQASLLEGDGEQWNRRRRARYALPMACSSRHCTDVADPWPLPLGDVSPVPTATAAGPSPVPAPETSEATSEAASDATGNHHRYTAALVAAGYREPAIEAVRPLGPGIAQVRVHAVPPGEEVPRTLAVWIRDGTSTAMPPDASSNPGAPFTVLGTAVNAMGAAPP